MEPTDKKKNVLSTAAYFEYAFRIVNRFTGFSQEELSQLIPYLHIRVFDRKEIILQPGQVEEYLSLVVKGLVRKYTVVNKKETTLQLATEGHVIQSEYSFHRRVPSDLAVQAIEPSVLVSIQYDRMQEALRDLPRAEEIGRLLVTYMFIKKDARSYASLKNNTRERFLQYINQHPHMLQRVPQKILASYLNIKPETFSRLKHLVLKQGTKA